MQDYKLHVKVGYYTSKHDYNLTGVQIFKNPLLKGRKDRDRRSAEAKDKGSNKLTSVEAV